MRRDKESKISRDMQIFNEERTGNTSPPKLADDSVAIVENSSWACYKEATSLLGSGEQIFFWELHGGGSYNSEGKRGLIWLRPLCKARVSYIRVAVVQGRAGDWCGVQSRADHRSIDTRLVVLLMLPAPPSTCTATT